MAKLEFWAPRSNPRTDRNCSANKTAKLLQCKRSCPALAGLPQDQPSDDAPRWPEQALRRPVERRGWRTAQRKPVLNVELWLALEAAVAEHADVRWEWVRGHNGHALNERADQIASEEASRARR